MMNKGLSSIEAKEILLKTGNNELPASKPKNIWQIAFEVMKEPMFLLLIGSGVLYILLGDSREGIILLSTFSVIITITFLQYRKTEKALDALKALSAPKTTVIRDGVEVKLASKEIVPGDLIIVNEGDRVTADGVILESNNLIVDESMLTGESVPISKTVQEASENNSGKVFSGTMVVQGKGLVLVSSTGVNTAFGKIGSSLQSIGEDRTRLQKEMKLLIGRLFLIGAVLSSIVVAAFYYTRGNFLAALLNGLATAMSMLPEEFPVVLTIFFSLGAWRLSKSNVLTRKPSAIESLGAATVLCSDKTGTITQNKMELSALYDKVELFEKEDFLKNKLSTENLISCAYFASQAATVDPMEKAFYKAFETFVPASAAYTFLKEYPLSRDLLAMTRVFESPGNPSKIAFCKGAPEAIFKLCKLTEIETNKYLEIVQQMAEKGYRVIALAKADQFEDLPQYQDGFNFQFFGLLGLADPIRPEVPGAVKECREAGIKVVMITGDYPITAKSIALKIGIDSEGIMTGAELSALSDEELNAKISKISIFARVLPEQKLRIVNAFKANNEVVAMTGDGVNDAPALKAAHIGIAMGGKGTDVAREAASLVLLDDNFASIVSAIRSGRRIFDNLQKAMAYIIAIHIPIIGLALIPAFNPTIPIFLMPLHIVFMELIIDPVCSVVFETEQEEKGIMNRKPRNQNEQFFGGAKILAGMSQGLLLLASVIAVFFYTNSEGHSEGEVRAIAFSSLIIGNIFLILTNLSKTRSFISVLLERNLTILWILLSAFGMLFLIISLPFLQQIFSFEFPGYAHFIIAFAASTIMLTILETIKIWRNLTVFKAKI
jgi:Ca2+-transporting ATPase